MPKGRRVRRNEREHGSGSIKDLPNGSARAWKPPHGGKRPSKLFHPPDARAKAEAWLRGVSPAPSMPLGLWSEVWFTRRRARLRPRTVKIYARWFAMLEALADRQLVAITADDWQAHIDHLLTRYTWLTVQRGRGIWSAVLSAAVRAGHLARNPLLETALPTPTERIPSAWTHEDVLKLTGAARGHHHEAFLHLGLACGLRMGELRALTWPDVDLKLLSVTISKSLDNHTDQVGPTKSGKIRVVDLPEGTARILAEHRKRQDPACELVIGKPSGAYDPVTLRAWLLALCKRVTVTPRPPHSLRHTFAALAIAAGVDLETLSKALGHANIIITGTAYSHWISQRERRTARALGAALYQAPEPANRDQHIDLHNPDGLTR